MQTEQTVQAASDFSAVIAQRAADFTGREWVLRAVDAWLSQPDGERLFLLTGGPGSGKSAIAARLVQRHLGQVAGGDYLRLRPNFLSYYHFCQAGRDSTLAPRRFVEGLAQTLANRYPAYRQALEKQGATQYVIRPVLNIYGGVAAGAEVIGAAIGAVTIEILGGEARSLFDQLVRQPLAALCDSVPDVEVVILVDALDEALSFHAEDNIPQLLGLLADFPPSVRFLLTCRAHDSRLADRMGRHSLDLLADAPPGLNEVREYILGRLATVAAPRRSIFADGIAERSQGNFLYAYYVLNDILRGDEGLREQALSALPDGLEAIYRSFLGRELAASPRRWQEIYRPMLGLLAVARGDGLSRQQLIGITDLAEDTADDVLATCAPYLVGGEDGGAYRLYHQSFRDFLLNDDVFGVYPAERHAAIARYLHDRCGANWGSCKDDYALRYTPYHWAEAASLSESRRAERTRKLIELTGDARYQRRYESRIRDLPALQQDLTRALRVAALNEGDEMLPWLIRAGRNDFAFRRDYLRAESVNRLAEEGKVEFAEQRLCLFGQLDEDWLAAARLIVAWLAADANRDGAAAVLARATAVGDASEPLALLSNRMRAALRGEPRCAVDEQPAERLEVAQELVKRLGGQDFNRELLLSVNPSLCVVGYRGPQTEMLAQNGFAATVDAPLLVNIARAHGVEGTSAVDQYIDAHATYRYVEYRNRSLWIVMQAVLAHHPEQDWVKERLGHILIAALTGGGVEFRELLPLTVVALQDAARGVSSTLDDWRKRALAAADLLEQRRGADDSWGTHKRRLAGLMELYARIAGDPVAAAALLDRLLTLPGGFAGYQVFAQLRLADALHVAALERPGLRQDTLEQALRAAHHIQDYRFCALASARCNALCRWHAKPLVGQALTETIRRLAAAPDDGEFAADHCVHERYRYRSDDDPDTLPIAEARQAATLRQLAEVFQRPVADLLRLNPGYAIDEALPEGLPMRIPDPGLAPLLASHLAARLLADASLAEESGALLRLLLPVASRSPTALDTLLGYLLIAVQPDDPDLLGEIALASGPVVFADVAPPAAQIGPDAVTPT